MLIDTSGWLCAFHKDEPEHAEAVKLYEAATRHLTHSYILAEFVPLAQVRGFPRRGNLQFSKGIMDDAEVELIWVDESLHRQAVELLLERNDKTYSLCDAVSFLIMRTRGISDALTTDHHFEQEGFVRLLQPEISK